MFYLFISTSIFSQVYIEGQLQTRKWQDKGGQDRYTTEIVANEMQMLDSRGGADASQGGYSAPAQQGGYAKQPQSAPPQQAAPQQRAPQQQPAPSHAPQQAAPQQRAYQPPQQGGYAQQPPAHSAPAAPAPMDDFDDDIPF